LLQKSVKVARKKGYVSELLSIVGNENVPDNITRKLPEIFFDAIQEARSQEWVGQVLEIIGKEGIPEAVQIRAAEVAFEKGLTAEPRIVQQENVTDSVKASVKEPTISNNHNMVEEKINEKVDLAADLKAAIRSGKLPAIQKELDDYLSHFPKNEKDEGEIDVPEDEKEFKRVVKEVRDKRRWNGEVLDIIGKNGISEDIQKRAAEVALEKGLVDAPLKVKPEKVPESVVARVEELTEDLDKTLDNIQASKKQSAGFTKSKDRAVVSKYNVSNLLAMRDMMHVLYIFGIIEKEGVDNVRAALIERLSDAVKDAAMHGKYSQLEGLVGRKDIPEEAQVLAIGGIAENGDVTKILKALQGDNVAKAVKEEAVKVLPIAMKSAVKKGRVAEVVELIGKQHAPESAQVLAVKMAAEAGWDKRVGQLVERDGVPEKAKEIYRKLTQKNGEHVPAVKTVLKDIPDEARVLAIRGIAENGQIEDVLKALADDSLAVSVKEEASMNLQIAMKAAAKKNRVFEVVELIGKQGVPEDAQVLAVRIAVEEGLAERAGDFIERDGVPEKAKEIYKVLTQGNEELISAVKKEAAENVQAIPARIVTKDMGLPEIVRIMDDEGLSKDVRKEASSNLCIAVKRSAKAGAVSELINLIGKPGVPWHVQRFAAKAALKQQRTAEVVEKISGVADAKAQIRLMKMILGQGQGFKDYAKKAGRSIKRLFVNVANGNGFPQCALNAIGKAGVCEKAQVLVVRAAAKCGKISSVFETIEKSEVPEKVLMNALGLAKKDGYATGVIRTIEEGGDDEVIADKARAILPRTIKNAGKKGKLAEVLSVLDSKDDISEEAVLLAKEMLPIAIKKASGNRWNEEILSVVGREDVPEKIQIDALEETALTWGRMDAIIGMLWKVNASDPVKERIMELIAKQGYVKEILIVAGTEGFSDGLKSSAKACLKDAVESSGLKRDSGQMLAAIGNTHADEGLQIAALRNAVSYGQVSEALEAVISGNPPQNVQDVFLELAAAEGYGEKVLRRIGRNNVPETFKKLAMAKLKNPLESDGVLSEGRIKGPEAGKRMASKPKVPV